MKPTARARNSNPLLRTLPGEAGRFFRDVVLNYDSDECLPWPYSTNGGGYAQVWHDGRMRYVHELLAEHRYGPKPTPKHECAHGCRNGRLGCCAGRHIRYATHRENHADDKGRRKMMRRDHPALYAVGTA